MTERDLEDRLRAHLHRRFDGAQPPPELFASVRQSISTPPRRLGLPAWRSLRFRPGWTAIAAVLGIVLVAAAAPQLLPGVPWPGSAPSPSPAATPATRQFIVLPPTAAVPDKAQSSLASDILSARLEALFFVGDETVTFTGAVGDAITYQLPSTGPDDDTIIDVLSATGDVKFVPLPVDDYGTEGDIGPLFAEAGEPLPTEEPALLGWEGIESFEIVEDEQARRVLQIKLKPVAAQAFRDYTASHLHEFFAVVLDGRVAAAPSINEVIAGGEIQLRFGKLGGDPDALMAILVGGMLPEAWAQPVVPHVRPFDEFIPAVQSENPSAMFVSAELGVYESNVGFPWVAVWRMTFEGDFPQCRDAEPLPSFCASADRLVATVDAETGVGIP